MGVLTLQSPTYSAQLPWLIWTPWRAPSGAVNDTSAGHYPALTIPGWGAVAAGTLPIWNWSPQDGNYPDVATLAQTLQTSGDGKYSSYTQATSGPPPNSQFLNVTWSIPATEVKAGYLLGQMQFRVDRFTPSTNPRTVQDLMVCLVKNGVPLTAINKANANTWVHADTPETIIYTWTAADLATLGVTAADITDGQFGIAIMANVIGYVPVVPEGRIELVSMRLAYSPVLAANLMDAELPAGGALPGPWMQMNAWSGPLPAAADKILGLAVDITAYCDDAALPQTPVVASWWPGNLLVPDHSLFDPLEVALSLDGVNPVGETWLIFTTQTVTLHTCGTLSYLWGRPGGWQPGELSDAGFSVLVRRPAGHTAVSSQYVTSCRVRLATQSPEGTLTMPVRQALSDVVLLGAETTPGTLATSFQRMRALNYKFRPNFNVKKFRAQGEKMQTLVVPTREWVTGSISGLLDYNELPFVLESVMGPGVHGGAATVGQKNTHVYNLNNRTRSAYKSYSVQRGQVGNSNEQATYVMHSGLQIAITTQDCQVSGAFFAQAITDGITLWVGPSEVQLVTVQGTPTGGTFRLSFRGAETTDLAYNITAAALQTALQALSTIGAGNVLVTGTGPFTLTFSGALAAQNVPSIVMSKNGLTGGTTPTISVSESTRGGVPEVGLVPVLPGHWNIYLASSQATLAANKLDKTVGVAATGIDFADRWVPYYTLDRTLATGGPLTFTDGNEADPKFTAHLHVGKNTTGMSLLTTLRAGGSMWLMLEAIGPTINGTDNYSMVWQGCVAVADGADFGEEDGRVIMPWPLEWVEGPNGEVPTLTVINGIVSY